MFQIDFILINFTSMQSISDKSRVKFFLLGKLILQSFVNCAVSLRIRKPGPLAIATLGVLAWNSARVLAQIIWLFLLASTLGAGGYGVYAGVVGLALTFSGFVGMGLGLRMYQDGVRDPECLPLRERQAWIGIRWSSGILALGFVATARVLTDELNLVSLVSIAVSEIIIAPVSTQIAFWYASGRRMERSASVPAIVAVARVLAAASLLVLGDYRGIDTYVWLHLGWTWIVVSLLVLQQRKEFSWRKVEAILSWSDVFTGLGFSAVWASGLALSSMDKALLLLWGGPEVTGQYAVAYRFASVISLPIEALVMAAMPMLFIEGDGKGQRPFIVIAMIIVALVYSILAGVFISFTVGLLPWILGDSFSAIVELVHLLAAYVVIYCLRIIGVNVLLAYGLKRLRVVCEFLSLLVFGSLAIYWIPTSGLEGAVKALLGSEIMLTALAWTCFLIRSDKAVKS